MRTLEISAHLRPFFPSESHPRRRIRFQAGLERVKFDRLLWQTRARVEIFRARPYNRSADVFARGRVAQLE